MSIRIMIVEDEKETREEYRMLIHSSATMQLVAETDSEEEALEMLEAIPVDALILDLELRKGSGILLLEKLPENSIFTKSISLVFDGRGERIIQCR